MNLSFYVLSFYTTIGLWLRRTPVPQQGYSANTNYAMRSFYLVIFLFFLTNAYSQDQPAENPVAKKDSAVVNTNKADTSVKKKFYDPKIAARRSAIIPGWGQVYNKKYWKVPIIYGALATTGVVIAYNLKNYKDLKFAYAAKYTASLPPPQNDSTDYFNIEPELLPLSEETLRYNRDQFRRSLDYSVLIFILLWGLNVVDAAVDAHLKSFDVSPDLSLQIKPGRSQMAGTNGLSLVLNIGK